MVAFHVCEVVASRGTTCEVFVAIPATEEGFPDIILPENFMLASSIKQIGRVK